MSDSILVTLITLAYLAVVLWVGIRARGDGPSTLENYVAGGRHVGVLILFFILGAEIFSAFSFLGGPGWAYSRGAPAFYIIAYLGLIPITIWVLGPKVARLGRERGYLTQGDLISDHYRSTPLGLLAGVIGVLAMVPYLTVQIAGAGMLFQAATNSLVPFWLGALLAFIVVAAYVFTSGLNGIGWTNLVQGIMMIAIAWFLGLIIPTHIYGGVQEMFTEIASKAPEYLTIPGGGKGMEWGAFSTAVLVSAFGGAMWPHLFMKFYSADSGRSLRKVSVFYPLYAYLLIPLMLIGFAGILTFADTPLASSDRVLLELVINVSDFPAWVVGLMLSGALAAAMSTGANLAHTAAVVLTRDVLGPTVMRNATEQQAVKATRICVLAVSLVAYLVALINPSSLVILLLGAYGLIVQLMPMVLGALFFPALTKRAASLGALAGSSVFLIFQFAVTSPFGWHAGFWGLLVNTAVVLLCQKYVGHKQVNRSEITT
ncbi:sodium:solute symporter family protein [Halomonas huangheensis]|uniref:Sodium:solute symporter n=1 Tax=Halomonas huangheensis TaxID=1178482 RepID=W1NCS4_9GAMM|nr:sodium:solute symporter family protein [Halomonas huangheensis]ALM52801.1 sodium:solute symporter [Halomonas huangheensis]ERL53288.1 hypothetical protein BJB45_18625 [Halomonas huangheensis]